METYEWNQYTIYKMPIGKGSYSKVYYGVHKQTKMEIAMKKIVFNRLQSNIKDKVISEIHILQQMNHPHIIHLNEYKFDGEYIILITEYCQDRDLYLWMKSAHTLDELLSVITQMANGFEYLHEKGIIHRDIKPQNILLHHGIIKICDFGFSTLIKENHQLFHTVCGTPLYMSPELLFGKPYSHKTDIWALGVLWYTLMYKIHPFGELQNLDDYRSKINHPIEFPLFEIDYLVDIVKSMLSIEPEQRPDMKEIKTAIQLKRFSREVVLDEMESYENPAHRIHELEDHIFKLETALKEKETKFLSCFDSEEDVTGRGRTNDGYEQIQLQTNYFTPPRQIPKRPNSGSSGSSNSGSLMSSFGTFFNYLTHSFSR